MHETLNQYLSGLERTVCLCLLELSEGTNCIFSYFDAVSTPIIAFDKRFSGDDRLIRRIGRGLWADLPPRNSEVWQSAFFAVNYVNRDDAEEPGETRIAFGENDLL